jgi:hypothetical protein
MPTNFPTSVDNFTNPTANDSLNLPSHSTQHANANDAIEAIEGFLLGQTGNAWTSFTPTWTNLTVGNGTYNQSAYNLIGKTAIATVDFVFGTTSAITGDVQITLPAALARKSIASLGLAETILVDTGTNNFVGMNIVVGASATSWHIRAVNAAGTYAATQTLSSTIPMTWATGDRIVFSTCHEVA